MPTILTHTVTLTTTDKPRIERLINARTAKHPDDERSSHLTGAIGDVAFAAWAEHHRVLVEGPIAHSACNAVIRNRGSWSDRLRIGVRTTDERKGTWQRALRTSGFKVHLIDVNYFCRTCCLNLGRYQPGPWNSHRIQRRARLSPRTPTDGPLRVASP